MSALKKTRTREAQLDFDALSIEGNLLSPEWLSRAAQLAAGGQSESDYRVPRGLNLRDEIGRFWRIAQAHWSEFAAGCAGRADSRLVAERFVLALLRESLGFASLLKAEPVVIAQRSYPIGFAALGGRVPVVIAAAGSGLDWLSPAFGDDGRRRSAFGLVQEYLNAADGAMWGLTSDGHTLRVVRDNASLTRPAWIEADLQRIFTEERYADFAALWLLAYETRFGRDGQPVSECALETWRNAGREEGTRAREHLRRGVEDALVALGQGFLAHPDNQALRGALGSGALAPKDYFNQLLRLVYRLIFLLTVEERGVLHPDGADEKAKALYRAGYSLRRLSERSVKRSAHDRFADLWVATKIVFHGVETGEAQLGLPALAGIFSKAQCPALDSAKLENRALLLAVFKLSWLREDGALARVNWRDMGPEELGSVYESLLELVPQITRDGREFAFAKGGETKGNARKTTGSYYTPDSLVQMLLDSALEPVLQDTIAKYPQNPVEALLGLSIVDPACGSGHFLLAAARRLASHVARIAANGTPSATEYRQALRRVVGSCIYGVDVNPMAVELCKVSLWMEAVEPGMPLTFLNSHIQHGNALLGTTPALMAKGIPDAAWEPIEGDDRKVASALKKRNKNAPDDQRSFDSRWIEAAAAEAQAVASAVARLESVSDTNAEALATKESEWKGILGSAEYRRQKRIADAWCAAFVWAKQPGELADAAPTNELWRQFRDGQGQPLALTMKTVDDLSEQYRFFHWHLQFPHVFAKGGFDVVLGNPPWERVKLQEQEFFASRAPEIANAESAAKRKALIASLGSHSPQLLVEFTSALRHAEGESHLVRLSGRFPLCGRGDVNTYALFAEADACLLSSRGRAGLVVPSGIATEKTTRFFFGWLMDGRRLVTLLSFYEIRRFFTDTDSRVPFCLLTLQGAPGGRDAQFVFDAKSVQEASDPRRRVVLTAADIRRINPNTETCPTFRSRRDADITRGIYARVPVLKLEAEQRDVDSEWRVDAGTMFHLTNDSHLFVSNSEVQGKVAHRSALWVQSSETKYLPLYEAKMVDRYDHRFGDFALKDPRSRGSELPQVPESSLRRADYLVQPQHWVDLAEVVRRTTDIETGWVAVWRDITNAASERTTRFAVLPIVAIGNSAPYLMFQREHVAAAPLLLASFNSLALDYVARQKVAGLHLSFLHLYQLPAPSPSLWLQHCTWTGGTWAEFVRPRVLELVYTGWDLEAFAVDQGWPGPPFVWDRGRRCVIEAELDAVFFHLFGLPMPDVDHILDTFELVARSDIKAHGEYRTKQVILEIYNAMAEAARLGKPYKSRLDPPPADPRVAHPATRLGDRKKGPVKTSERASDSGDQSKGQMSRRRAELLVSGLDQGGTRKKKRRV